MPDVHNLFCFEDRDFCHWILPESTNFFHMPVTPSISRPGSWNVGRALQPLQIPPAGSSSKVPSLPSQACSLQTCFKWDVPETPMSLWVSVWPMGHVIYLSLACFMVIHLQLLPFSCASCACTSSIPFRCAYTSSISKGLFPFYVYP